MTQVRLRILGECIIEIGDSRLEPSATHVFALTLYLSIERDKLVSRSLLVDLLFPGTAANNASHNLRQLLYRLRHKGVPLECSTTGVMLSERFVTGAPESALNQTYAEALEASAHRVLLPGYQPPTGPLSSWLESYRDTLTHKLQTRLSNYLHRARQGADWSAVERFARSLLSIDPLNETATLGLAESLARAGAKQRAIQLLHDYARDVGESNRQLVIPSRILTRRISEEVNSAPIVSAPLIGRSTELRELTAAWSHAKKGNCSVICLVGEKSIGKSRVLDELASLIRLDGSGTVLMYRPLPSDRERPMSLLSDICRQLLQLPGAAGCSPESLRFLEPLIAVPERNREATTPSAEASVTKTCTRNAIIDLLDSVSTERALLLCVDDAERLDQLSLDTLAALPALSPTSPVYFVLAGIALPRSTFAPSRTLRLTPLSDDHTRQLAEHITANAGYALSGDSMQWSVSAASGNPGHLELLLRHVSALREPPSAPPSLLALIDERLQALSQSERHILQACVVFGSECSTDTVAALTGIDGYALLEALDSLVINGLVTDSHRGIACRSSLFADRVARNTTLAARSIFHRRAAEFLERLPESSLPSQQLAWRIADHWSAASNRTRALHWRRVCWQQLISIGQPLAAAESIRACMSSAAAPQERADLLDQLSNALRQASDARGELQILKERATLSEKVGDNISTRLALSASIAEARYHSFDDTTQLLPELRALLRAPLLAEERRLGIARVLLVTADSMLSEQLAREAVDAVPDSLSTSRSIALGLEIRTIYHATFGDSHTARDLGHLLHAVAAKQELSPLQVASHLTASLALRIVDTGPTEIGLLTQLYRRCVDASMFGIATRVAARLGCMLHEDGDIDGAEAWCSAATEIRERSGIQRVASEFLTLQVDLALARGDAAYARRVLENAPSQFPMYSSPKWTNAYHVYTTRVEQHDPHSRISAERVSALLDWHARASHLGRHDDHVEVLWNALRREGRYAEATAMLTHYLTRTRREQRPCIFILRTRTADDPAWAILDDGGQTSLPAETTTARAPVLAPASN